MYQAFMVVHVLIALAIIGLVMLQQGRGADAGAGFGGASNSVFGARGASSFLSRTTAILASVFFVSSLALAYMAGNKDNKKADIMDAAQTSNPVQQDLPPVIQESANPAESAVPAVPQAQEPAPAQPPEPVPAQESAPVAAQPEKKSDAPASASQPAKKATGKKKQ